MTICLSKKIHLEEKLILVPDIWRLNYNKFVQNYFFYINASFFFMELHCSYEIKFPHSERTSKNRLEHFVHVFQKKICSLKTLQY
jgi:hypothetical protein